MFKKKNRSEEKVEVKVVSPEEDKKKLNESLDTIELKKTNDEKPFGEAIEEERGNIFKIYKKTRVKNNIIMVATVAIFAAATILIMRQELWGKIVGGVALGGVVIFLLIHYLLTKNLFPDTTKKYIRFFMVNSDNYVLENSEINEAKLLFEKRYAVADVLADRVYKDVIDSASRNIIEAKYKENPFQFGELALYKAGAKRYQKSVIFVGKYLSFENKLHFKDRYIVNIKGEKDIDVPNDIEDLKVLCEQNRFVIYGPEGADYEKDLGKELIENLKSIECVGSLLNVNIVFWAGHTSAYLSYDDKIVAIPFDHAVEVEPYNQLKKNLNEILEILG